MVDLSVNIAGLELKNPIIPASGCCGYGESMSQKFDLNLLGGLVFKSTTLEERAGNPAPQYAHTPSAVLNAVGLKNPGLATVRQEKIPFLAQFEDLAVIASVAGSKEEDYVEVVKALSQEETVKAIELNISCPNVKEGGVSFGTDPQVAARLTRLCKEATHLPLWVKLTPNVTDIVAIAKAVEEAGADALVMINTLTGLAVDVETGLPQLANITGGISGPSIRHLALRMVYQVYSEVAIPIIGVGGIESVDDVIAMLMVGASAVEIGTANYAKPLVCPEIIQALPGRLSELGFDSVASVTGHLHRQLANQK
ncbi:dihydroorotate dehydrogenase [Hutsoniella sourekii]|uniref:dihydroorotate dehydrogenase n=1 Tax=Hutsoniella sourekii TaxID=87650 RepID=UPI000484B088|nr:dihydroorotate dehydrogenase [Hutsoniella sourekii]